MNKDIVADRHLCPSLPLPASTAKSQLLQVRVAARRNVVTQTDKGIRLHWTAVQRKDLKPRELQLLKEVDHHVAAVIVHVTRYA